jgi:transcriptional regulator with XRE-family HTH domain
MHDSPLRVARLAKGKTYKELSELSAVDISTIRSMELGQGAETIRRAQRIAKSLRMKVSDLWPEDG